MIQRRAIMRQGATDSGNVDAIFVLLLLLLLLLLVLVLVLC